MPAILQQFHHPILNKHTGVSWSCLLVGDVVAGPRVGYATDGGIVDRMVCRAISWHVDLEKPLSHRVSDRAILILQVIRGDGFLVQDTRRLAISQPVGTIIVMDDRLRHRLLAPSPDFSQRWGAQYRYIEPDHYTAIADDQAAIASCLQIT